MSEWLLFLAGVPVGAGVWSAVLLWLSHRREARRVEPITRLGPGRFRVIYPCGDTEIVEADSPGELLRKIRTHVHGGDGE